MKRENRHFMSRSICSVAGVCRLLVSAVVWVHLHSQHATFAEGDRPNVIVVITDDQGYGDIGAHGNTMIRTPQLDRLRAESVRLTDFHVDPTCSPTRAALMTGRYSTRTGVWHTIQGRSLMDPGELTLAEIFAANHYRTGLFGKWHLGDNAPLRPQDQGFQTVLMHGGGGVGQTPDWWGNDYFDDTYVDETGKAVPFTGYCTDVWFREALRFIQQAGTDKTPFFCYIATNSPHGPYLVADEEKRPYLDAGVPEPMASFYGMITNIDRNVGVLLSKLDDWQLSENTILVFMTDNGTAAGAARGPQKTGWTGFNAGMRGQKGSQYDGGHRVPFFVRWPKGGLHGGKDVDILSAHIDLLPTFLELCRLDRPQGPPIDGISLAPWLTGKTADPLERTLFVHSQRIEHPEKWRTSAVMTKQWRLIDGRELYDMTADPAQTRNLADGHPVLVERMRADYEQWWESLSPAFEDPVRIDLGTKSEAVTRLTCHDWHTDDRPVPWNQDLVAKNPQNNGVWAVRVTHAGRYEFTLRLRPEGVDETLPSGTAKVEIAGKSATKAIPPGSQTAVLTLEIPAGPTTLQTWLESDSGQSRGAYFVTVRPL